jgi:hypothetical protein
MGAAITIPDAFACAVGALAHGLWSSRGQCARSLCSSRRFPTPNPTQATTPVSTPRVKTPRQTEDPDAAASRIDRKDADGVFVAGDDLGIIDRH